MASNRMLPGQGSSCSLVGGFFVKNIVTFAAAAVLAISTGGIAAAATLSATSGHHQPVKMPAHNPGLTTLYSQTEDSGIGIVSQNFESNYAAYDSSGADDFTVPKGSKWTIKEIDVTGVYFNGSGPATSEAVTFYKVTKGVPGKVKVATITVKGKDSSGSFAMTFKKAVKLKAGSYFVGVAANLTFAGGGGEWGWETTSTAQTGNPAAWENPGGGFGTSCTKWGAEDVCIASGNGPDKVMTILGSAK